MSSRARLAIALFVATWGGSAWGAQLTTLANLTQAGGKQPHAGVVLDGAGNLYGTAQYGGTFDRGVVFEVAANTNAFSALGTFTNNNGAFPAAGLTPDGNGNFYGTTYGTSGTDDGLVFKYDGGTHQLSTVAKFASATSGANPNAAMIMDGAGNLYGTAVHGGANGVGTVFEIVAGTGKIQVLASLSQADGGAPLGGLYRDKGGDLYGVSAAGGNNFGSVFKVAAGTGTLSVIASFNQSNGAYPYGTLAADSAGNLYGTTAEGGTNDRGTVFQVDPTTKVLKTLAHMGGGILGRRPDSGLLIDGAGNLFGTTAEGGASGMGTIFEVAAGTLALSTQIDFTGANGSQPEAGLIADGNGVLYGTTSGGGTDGLGTVFQVTRVGFVVVPEPTSAVMAGVAAIGLASRRRR